MVFGLAGSLAIRAGVCAVRVAARERREERRRQQLYAPIVISQPGAQLPPGYATTPTTATLERGDREPAVPDQQRRLKGGSLYMVVGCQIFLYILAVPLFIVSMVLFNIANGAYDASYFELEYDECDWSPWYNRYESHYAAYDNDPYWCDEGFQEWEDWQTKKQSLKVIAIVMCVLFGGSLLTAIILSTVTCAKNCGNKSPGLVRHEYLPAMSPVTQTIITTTNNNQQPPPFLQVVNPMMQPVPEQLQPPSYSYDANQPYRQDVRYQPSHMAQPPPQEQIQMASPYETGMTSQYAPSMSSQPHVSSKVSSQYSHMASK